MECLDSITILQLLKEVNVHTGTNIAKILTVVIVLLIIALIALGYRNSLYQTENRMLILQNDSLMGANIELSKIIDSKALQRIDSSVTLGK